jgi:hypothetical protein
MSGALYITDGTTRINLLTGIDGFMLVGWNPSIAPAADTWRASPLADGRKLAMSKWANAIETFSFHVARFTQDDVIYETQELRRLLEAAKQYFIGGSDVPVWLEARGNCETNTRYAVVCNYSTGNDSDPYHKPFDLDHPVMSPWTLVVERQHWRDVAPGLSTCVQLSATQAYYDAAEGAYVPTQSDDDTQVNITATTITLAATNGAMGNILASTYGAAVRFRNVTIPVGATIINAYIEFESDGNYVADNCNVLIVGDDADNAGVFVDWANYAGRTRTTAHVHWAAIPHWVAGTHYQTVDIATVVQEIVSRAGWASGNAMAILLEDDASTANAVRNVVLWDHAAARYEPHLIVHWYDATTRTFGRTATCNNEVYVANKHNMAQITHSYHYTAATGVYSANLIGAALPFNILPAVPAVGDIVYFGIATGIANSGPFCSLVFDLVRETNMTGESWEYYNGGAWAALTVQDNTNADGAMTNIPFDSNGVRSVHWDQPSNFTALAINGVTAYWVRLRVTGVGGAPTAPQQQNRDIYTIVTPYVDTLAAQVPGDIQALAQTYIHGQSGLNGSTAAHIRRAVVGLRSYDKGSLFTPYLNLADEQNQTGVTVTVNAGTATFTDDVTSPTGRVIDFTTAGLAARAWLCYVTINSALTSHYIGDYRCFLRFKDIAGNTGTFWLTIGTYNYTTMAWTSQPKATSLITYYRYIDFGKITLPPTPHDLGETYDSIVLRIDGAVTTNTHMHLSGIILIPCDECLIETGANLDVITNGYSAASYLGHNPANVYTTETRRLDIDSLVPRRFLTTEVEHETSGATVTSWYNRSTSQNILKPNERQRWWFYFDMDGGADSNISRAASVQGWKVSRYLSMRGAR